MDDNYMNEALPRWQFWKEYLIVSLEEGGKEIEKEKPGVRFSVEVIEKVKKMNDEMIEKAKKIKNKTGLKKP